MRRQVGTKIEKFEQKKEKVDSTSLTTKAAISSTESYSSCALMKQNQGGRHSSVVTSMPTILRFESQAHHLCFFQFVLLKL